MIFDSLSVGGLGDRRRYARVGYILPIDHLGIFDSTLPDKQLVQDVARQRCSQFRLNYIEPDSLRFTKDADGYEKLGTLIEWCRQATGRDFVVPDWPAPGSVVLQHFANRYAVEGWGDDGAWKRDSYAVWRAGWEFVAGELKQTRFAAQVKYFALEYYYTPEVIAGLPGVDPATAYRSAIGIGQRLAAIFGKPFLPFLRPSVLTPEAAAVCRAWQGDKLYWDDVAIAPQMITELVG